MGPPAFWRQNLRYSWGPNFYIWPSAYWRTILKLCNQSRLLTLQEVPEARVMWNVPGKISVNTAFGSVILTVQNKIIFQNHCFFLNVKLLYYTSNCNATRTFGCNARFLHTYNNKILKKPWRRRLWHTCSKFSHRWRHLRRNWRQRHCRAKVATSDVR